MTCPLCGGDLTRRRCPDCHVTVTVVDGRAARAHRDGRLVWAAGANHRPPDTHPRRAHPRGHHLAADEPRIDVTRLIEEQPT